MSVLKIETDRTIWLTEVKRVTKLGEFMVKAKENNEGAVRPEEHETNPVTVAGQAGLLPNESCVANETKFENRDHNVYGCALLVDRVGDRPGEDQQSEYWLVPTGACFLMSDIGKTIDRI